jgi:hypothetical protein
VAWLRRLLVPVLLIALLAGTYAAGFNIVFGTPDNLKTWLHDSRFYDHLINYGVDRAVAATSPTDATTDAASDPNVIQAVKTAFPPQLIEDSVNTFLDSNYAWLQGKSDQPDFSIDLNAAKQTLGQQLGQYAGERYATLPACGANDIAQLRQSEDYNLLSVNCQLPGVSAAGVSALVTGQVNNSGEVLQDPTLTPETIGQNFETPQSGYTNKPYYADIPDAPHLYKFSRIVPWIAFVIAVAGAIGIVLLNPLRRKGLKVVGIVLAIAAAWLLISKLLVDAVFGLAEDALDDSSVAGQLQTAFVEVLHKAEHALTQANMWFAIGFAGVAASIFGFLVILPRIRPSQPAAPKPPRP